MGKRDGDMHIYIYTGKCSHSYVLVNATIHSLSFRDFLPYRKDGNTCMPASYRAVQGPKDKGNFPHALTTAVVNDHAPGRLLAVGLCRSLHGIQLSRPFSMGGRFLKELPTSQEARRARTSLGSL